MNRVVHIVGPRQLELRELPDPLPGPGELVLEIDAATTCGTDLKVWRRGGHPTMLVPPSPFGHEMAGRIGAVGRGIDFKEGDRLVVANSAPCGCCQACESSRENLCPDLHYLNGAYADRILVPARFVEKSCHPIPDGLSAELAALAEPLACVLHGIEVLDLRRDDEILVLGGGPIGLGFVAVLAALGHRVCLADPNPPRLETGQKLGAVSTILVDRATGVSADALKPRIVVEATGNESAWLQAMEIVNPGGEVLLFGGLPSGATVPLDCRRLHYDEITVRGAYHHRPPLFAEALRLLGGGAVDGAQFLQAERSLTQVDSALACMEAREALKVVIRP